MISKKGSRMSADALHACITLKKHPDNEKQESDNENEDPSTIMDEAPSTIIKKQDIQAKHNLELERIKNVRELQVGYN